MPAQNTNHIADEQRSEALLSTAPERAILVGVDMPGNDWLVEEIECGCVTGTGDCVFALKSTRA